MKSFAELTAKQKCIEVVRWFCVLPAAVLAGMVPRLLYRLLVPPLMVQPPGVPRIRVSDFQRFYLPHIMGAIMAAAFVIVGAKVAPRYRVAVAAVLAVLWIVYSYTVHVLPHQGHDPRFYRYFFVATIAAAAAVAYVAYSNKRQTDP
jgi:hypothetical protein